jgi:hypothetical protein
MGRENEDEDVSSYWMPLRKRKDAGNLKEEALERTLENSPGRGQDPVVRQTA